MSRKRDPKREALVARIDARQARFYKCLAALRGKWTRFNDVADDLKRARKALADYDAEPLGDDPAPAPEKRGDVL